MKTSVGICIEAAYNSGEAAKPSGWWHERKVVIEKLKPQVVRTGAKDKGTLDQMAALGATVWPVFTEDAKTILSWLKTYWGHKAQCRGVSRGNEPWFYSTSVQGDAWARQCKPIYEALRNDPDIGHLLHLSVPIIPSHSRTPNFFAKFIAAWPDFYKVIDSIDLHPYSNKTDPMSSSPPGLKWHFEFCRAMLDSHGGKDIVFVASEFGNSTHGSGSNAYDVVSEQTQADWENKSFDYMIQRGDVMLAMPYMTCDSYKASDNENEQRHFGHYYDPPPGGAALTPKRVAPIFVAKRQQQLGAGAPNIFGEAAPTPPNGGGSNGGDATAQLIVAANVDEPNKVHFSYDPEKIKKIKVYQADSAEYPAPAGSYQYNTIDPAVQDWIPTRLAEQRPTVYVDGIGLDADGKEVGKWYSDTLPTKILVSAHYSATPPRKPIDEILLAMVPDLQAAIQKQTGKSAIVILPNVPEPGEVSLGSDDYLFTIQGVDIAP